MARRDESGYTLLELLVVLAISSVLGVMVYSMLIQSTWLAARADNSTRAENNARLALRTLTEDLRSAEQIQTSSSTTACPSSLTYPAGFAWCIGFLVPHEITANATTTTIAAGAAPIACPYSTITYGLISGVLREDRINYNAACTSTSSFAGKAVLSGIDNTSTQPLFTFYDTFGNKLGTSNATADFQHAGSITLQIYLNYQQRAPDISLMATVALRNNR